MPVVPPKTPSKTPVKPLILFLFLGLYMTMFTLAAQEQIFGITSFYTEHYGGQKQNWSFIQDHRGVLFIANSGGIFEYDSLDWRLIEVPGGGVFALAKDERGRIFAGGTGEIGYLAVEDNGALKYKSLMSRLPPEYRDIQDRVVQIQAIPGGMVFLFERLLVVLTEGNTETYKTQDHFFSFIYRAGSLYVLDSARGLLKAGKGKLTTIPGGQLLRAHVMLPYGNDKILVVTTHKGPLIFDPRSVNNSFRPFLKAKNDYFLDNIVTCGVMLRSGHVMLGSLEKSIAIFPPDGGAEIRVGPNQGLPDNIVYGLFQDAEGNAWVGMDNGISLLRSPFFATSVKTQGAAKGAISSRIPFAALIRGCRRFADDTFIFRGAFYDLRHRIQQSRQQPHQVQEFAYAFNGFRFSFSTNSFEETGRIVYQCKLDGQEPEWSNWSDRTVREYTNLHWGHYTLRVRAKNLFGKISEEARFTFIVNPPWHETWWFLVSQITFIFLVLVGSRLIERMGKAPKVSQYMIVFAVIIIFEYFNGFISPYIGRYSDGIAFFGMLMTAILSIVIGPAEDFILTLMKKIIKGKET